MEKVKAGLRGVSASQKVVIANVVHEHMLGNPHFAGAGALLAELQDTSTKLAEANSAALDRGRIACAHKREMVKCIDSVLSRLATYVNSQAAGDVAKLVSSGFPLAKTPSPISSLDQVHGISFRRAPFPNTVQATWKSVWGAVMYRVETAALGLDPAWTQVALTTRPEAVVHASIEAKPQQIRVCALGTQTQGPYSTETGVS